MFHPLDTHDSMQRLLRESRNEIALRGLEARRLEIVGAFRLTIGGGDGLTASPEPSGWR